MANTDNYLPEEEVHTRPYALLLKDIWWALRTKTGSILRAPITRYGPDGLPNGETTAEAEFGWNRENIASIKYKQDKMQEQLDRIEKQLGGGK